MPIASEPTVDENLIRELLAQYNGALNKASTTDVMALYAQDCIFMPPFSPSAVGMGAVQGSYDAVFDELMFDVKFDIQEIVQLAPTWAYARTNSSGTTRHSSTGGTTSEANQELFILTKESGAWKIARYSFSPTQK
jgi:uncharacterized protein (TIGR02246 family)